MWIDRLTAFRTQDGCDEQLARRATYEIVIASLKCYGSVIEYEQDLLRYFNDIKSITSPADFEDAAVLLCFCRSAIHLDACQVPGEQLDDATALLRSRLVEHLAVTTSATQRCFILDTLGYAALMFTGPASLRTLPAIEGAMKYWGQLLNEVSDAPMYPLERFHDRLAGLLELPITTTGYEKLTEKIDVLLSDRYGAFVAAEKCKDRALRLYKGGQILSAIRELHHAKLGWFAEEALDSSLLTMLQLADWYRELHLPFAAKQYAMAVAYVSGLASRVELWQLVPRALLMAAECDYLAGAWCDYASGLQAYRGSFTIVAPQYLDETRIDNAHRSTLLHIATMMTIAKRFAPQVRELMMEKIAELGYGGIVDEAITMADHYWAPLGDDDVWNELEDQMYGRPFSDIGPERISVWRQLGLSWEVSYHNSATTIASAEAFVATCQIVMTELAGVDLVLMPTVIKILIDADEDISASKIVQISSNDGRMWRITIPAKRLHNDSIDHQHEMFDTMMTVLAEVSLLPMRDLTDIVTKACKDGIASKLLTARPYEELHANIACDQWRSKSATVLTSRPEAKRPFNPLEHEAMRCIDGPGPGFDESEARADIQNRYDVGNRYAGITIARLAKDGEFMNIVNSLRQRRWRDWHLMLAIVNIILDYRVVQPRLRLGMEPAQMHGELQAALLKHETYQSLWVPSSCFSKEALERAIAVAQLSFLKMHNLELRQATPDFRAISNLLDVRYRYWTLDVDHSPIFV